MDKFTTRYLSPEEYSLWEGFVEKNVNGTVFHHFYWNEFIFSGSSGVHLSIAGCFAGEKLVAGTVLAIKKRGGLKFLAAPFASPYYGILVEERESKFHSKKESHRLEIIKALLTFLGKEVHYVDFSLPPGFQDIRAFTREKFAGQVRYTYRTGLKDIDRVYDSFLPALKRQIKKGEKLPHEVRTSVDSDHLKVVFDLILKSYKRQQQAFRFSFGQMKKLLETEKISQKIRLFSIWLGDKPVSAMIIVVDKDCAYYWLAGGDHDHFPSGLNQLLMWKVLQGLAESDIECFDFVGANTETISRYKSSFGFELVPYHHVAKAMTFWLKWILYLKGIAG